MIKFHKYHCLSSPEGGHNLLSAPKDCVKIISLTCNGNPLDYDPRFYFFHVLAPDKPFLKVVIPEYPYYSAVTLEYDDDWSKE